MHDVGDASELFDLSPTEAAALIPVHVDTLKRWSDDGLLPCLRTPGGHRRYRRSDVLAFMLKAAAGDAA